MKKTISILITLLSTSVLWSQNVDFKASNFKGKEGFKAAKEAVSKGNEYYDQGMEAVFNVSDYGLLFKKALIHFNDAQKFNPNNGELNFRIGVCHVNSSDPSLAIPYLKKAWELDPKADPFLQFYLGVAYQLEGKFDEAIKQYESFENNYRKADNYSKFSTKRIKECELAKKAYKKPERVWVDNISELNTSADEIAPSISTDGSELILSSNRKTNKTSNEVGEYDMDILSTSLRNGKWSYPKHISGAINTMDNEVSNTLSYDGTRMLLHRETKEGSDIYESHLKGANWTDPEKMSSMISSTKANEKYGCYNDDGYKVYFTRDNDNRSNGMDIMFSSVQSKIRKDFKAATMVSTCNSKFNEGPIYMSVDGDLMYFASEGHGSLGGYDIFVSEKKQGQWTEPVNLGYPINTVYDDFFFSPTANGKYAYIASNRSGGKGGFDIYKITFWGEPKEPAIDIEDYLLASVAMPLKDNQIESTVDVNKKSLTVFKGNTLDAISRKAVEASIEITDNSSGKIIETFTSNSATGKFIITLNSGRNYGIAVKAPGYLFHSENFDIPMGSADNLVDKTIELKNIAVGSKIALRNIFFDVGKATLRSESNAELERLVKLMKDVPGLKIEISGHTDDTGSALVNDKLSQDRAEAVMNYLAGKGISAGRMTAKGYGSSRPVSMLKTTEGRQMNRRTEFEILSN